MQIDWFTLGAEIVNFLILVWLLQRFLYKPVIAAMSEREQKIANQLEEAAEKRQQADEEVEKYRAMQQELEQQRDKFLQEAREDAQERRHKLMDKAHQETDEMRRNWYLAIQQEKDAFLNEIQQRVGSSTIEIAQRVLTEMADSRLESRVVNVFVRRLHSQSEEIRHQISEMLGKGGLRIDSAFELSDEDRSKIEETLQHLADNHLEPVYVVVSDMLCGVRLSTGEYEVSWDFADYTSALRDQFASAIEEEIDESVLAEADKA
jgi:F-type H+-transporting ATPase subunit b